MNKISIRTAIPAGAALACLLLALVTLAGWGLGSSLLVGAGSGSPQMYPITAIAPELLPDVFGLFTQAQRTPDRALGGLGLGLALMKNLVGLHGGEVQAASAGPGHGSTFTVSLPRLDEEITLAPDAAASTLLAEVQASAG